VFEDLKRLVAPVVFRELLIVLNSCVLNFGSAVKFHCE
jgi:hypothetical protein